MMKLKILEEKNNNLFDRREIKSVVEAEITPSRKEILDVLAEKYKVPRENIKIKGIHGKFGSKTFAVEANIYSSKETREKVELKKKKEQESEKQFEEASAAAEPVEAKEQTGEKQEEPKEENGGKENTVNTKTSVDNKLNEIQSESEANK